MRLVLVLAAVLLVGACTGRKEPEQKPQTLVVPEVSFIPFEIIDLNEAPSSVKKIAQSMNEHNFITWTQNNGSGYVIVYPEGKGSVKIDRIEQRVTDTNHSWLNVKLKYSPPKEQDSEAQPIVAEFDLMNSPKTMGFQISGIDTAAVPGENAQVKKESITIEEKENQSRNEKNISNDEDLEEVKIQEGPVIRITRPAPGEAVKSPVTVSGVTALEKGEVRVCIIDSSGQVLAEKPVQVTDSKFETTLSFSISGEDQQGSVEAFIIDPGDNTELGRVSISVIIQT